MVAALRNGYRILWIKSLPFYRGGGKMELIKVANKKYNKI